MTDTALHRFIAEVRTAWGPLGTDMAAQCVRALERLAQAPATEPWLAALHQHAPENEELHRDPVHGFMLLAHTEPGGLYRPPHDHGRSWGIYAVQSGEMDMATFARIEDDDGRVRLVQRDATRLGPGQAKLFLPGDIHDTRCVSGRALLFRFTERDLGAEDRLHGQVTRYRRRDNGRMDSDWTA